MKHLLIQKPFILRCDQHPNSCDIVHHQYDEIKENCQLQEDIFLQHHILRINPKEKSSLNDNLMAIWLNI